VAFEWEFQNVPDGLSYTLGMPHGISSGDAMGHVKSAKIEIGSAPGSKKAQFQLTIKMGGKNGDLLTDQSRGELQLPHPLDVTKLKPNAIDDEIKGGKVTLVDWEGSSLDFIVSFGKQA